MINSSATQFSADIKHLSKKFKFYDKFNIKLLFQFCEFDAEKTFKVLTMVQQMPTPISLIHTLISKPELSDTILKELEYSFDKKYGKIQAKQEEEEKNELNDENEKEEEPAFEFFKQVPSDVCLNVMFYLDPESFCNLSMTNSHFLRLSSAQSLKDYFKKLCMILFHTDTPILPNPTRFLKVRDYVLSRPLEFSPNSRNAVVNNLSYYVWKSEPKSFKLQKNYYLSFGSYKNLFFQCPRPNFNGYYLCKHKYLKVGEKTYKNSFTPIHVIYHYRYIRFLEDGSILYYVVPKRLPQNSVGSILSAKEFEQDEDKPNGVMIGQYMQYKDKLYVKTIKSNTMFSFQFQIQSNKGKVGQHLSVLHYTLQMVDENEILQTLFEAKPHKQPLVFQYVRNKTIQEQNSERIQACSF